MSDTHERWCSMLKDAPHNDYCNADLIEELHDALMSEAMANQDEKLRQKDELIRALADALEFVHKSSVNERTWNDATGKVDDMKAIVAAALAKAGRKP